MKVNIENRKVAHDESWPTPGTSTLAADIIGPSGHLHYIDTPQDQNKSEHTDNGNYAPPIPSPVKMSKLPTTVHHRISVSSCDEFDTTNHIIQSKHITESTHEDAGRRVSNRLKATRSKTPSRDTIDDDVCNDPKDSKHFSMGQSSATMAQETTWKTGWLRKDTWGQMQRRWEKGDENHKEEEQVGEEADEDNEQDEEPCDAVPHSGASRRKGTLSKRSNCCNAVSKPFRKRQATERATSKLFKCPKGCGSVCKRATDLRRHIKICGDSDGRVKCPRCDHEFSRPDALKRHHREGRCSRGSRVANGDQS